MSAIASRVENRRSNCSLPVVSRRGFRLVPSVRFGLVLFPVPAHRTGLAVFPHQMCSSTFDALCGFSNYVASGSYCLDVIADQASPTPHKNCLQGPQEGHQLRIFSPRFLALWSCAQLAGGQGFGLHL